MKKFLTKTLLTLLIFLALYMTAIESIFYFASSKTIYGLFEQDWITINQRLDNSKSRISQDTLYVGCSVANQLYPYNASNQLTSNGSAYTIGNYFIIKNAISTNENIKTVIYVSVPDVIGHKIERKRTYNYFVKPFFTTENRASIMKDKPTREALNKNPLLNLSLFNSYKVLAFDDYNYSDGKFEKGYLNSIESLGDSLSEISLIWLSKTKSLCDSSNVKFHLASPPVATSRLNNTSNWNVMRSQVKDTDLEELFDAYFKTIYYVDDAYLKDQIHWKRDYIEAHKAELITYIKDKLTEK